MLISKKGISALQMHRVVFGEDSAWYMCHRWLSAMRGDALKLTGEVELELDETFLGGKEKNKHKRKRIGLNTPGFTRKVAVIGAIGRKGMFVAKIIENTDTATRNQFVHQTVSEDV